MKLNITYGNGVLAVPEKALARPAPDNAYYPVLLLLAANPALRDDETPTVAAIAGALSLPADTVRKAFSYWKAEGILAPTAEEAASLPARIRPQSEEHETAVSLAAQAEKKQSVLPSYTKEELAHVISSDPALPGVLDACQTAVGKMFSEHEAEQITALYDSYGFDGEYLLTLFALCKKRGKLSVSYAVRTALSLYDEGVRTTAELEAKIAYDDRLSDISYKIRRLFGIGERAFTKSESRFIETWTETWKMPFEVIECAYELTIRAIEKPRMSYINKILSRWNDEGIRTVEQVEKAEAEYALTRQAASASKDTRDSFSSTFEVDEFADLAMKRSFPDT